MMKFQTQQSRRVRIYRILGWQMLSVFFKRTERNCQSIEVSCFDGIPEDARIVAVYTQFGPTTIEVLVEHESFEEVQDGVMPPSDFQFDIVRQLFKLDWKNGTAAPIDEADDPQMVEVKS